MATAGSGDVLTGVITALAGQGLSDFDAAVLGVYIHGLAGDIAAENLGQVSLMTTDIIDALPEAFMRS
jgi:NAD(P)H-hydrate epimerase